ncbi:MAG TPA: ABC transporter ATP-binding protein [Pirellulales bacterium]|nr:ABC transporter ATP-binding protein [Pirellulales bacterium]
MKPSIQPNSVSTAVAGASGKPPAVSCRGVTKKYGEGNSEVLALRGVDLDVYPGELTLLVGPSGCGKTTLLSVLAGILNPTAGDMVVLGTRPAGLSEARKVQFRRQNIGFVFQQFNLLPSLSAAENVCVPLLLSGWSRRKAMRVAVPLMERMGMTGRLLDALPTKLSGGQQQRVAIARALCNHPRLLVCDEPTSALDGQTGRAIMELLRAEALEGDRAVIIVTHDNRTFGFADRIAQMEDGRVAEVHRQQVNATAASGFQDAYHFAPADPAPLAPNISV